MKIVIVFFTVLIGILISKSLVEKKGLIKFLLVFSAGFLLSVSFMELFPVIYNANVKNIGIFILLGVVIQIVLEFFSKGLEHGHAHFGNEKNIPVSIMVGLLLHAFIEGIAIADNHSELHLNHLWIAVTLHKLPIAILFGTVIFALDIPTKIRYSLCMLFAICTPLGMWVGEYIPNTIFIYLLAINAGVFLHISSLIIFESNKNHNFNIRKLAILLVGIVLGILI